MLCDLTSVDLDACFGNGTTTCALPAGACLTADEVELQGAGASPAHAALLARDRARDTTASAVSDDDAGAAPSAGAPPSPESSPARSRQTATVAVNTSISGRGDKDSAYVGKRALSAVDKRTGRPRRRVNHTMYYTSLIIRAGLREAGYAPVPLAMRS
jgi:hypothetical protein